MASAWIAISFHKTKKNIQRHFITRMEKVNESNELHHSNKCSKNFSNTFEIRRSYLQFWYLSSLWSFLFWWNVAFALAINRTKMSTQCSKRSFKVFTFQFSTWFIHCSTFFVSLCKVADFHLNWKCFSQFGPHLMLWRSMLRPIDNALSNE